MGTNLVEGRKWLTISCAASLCLALSAMHHAQDASHIFKRSSLSAVERNYSSEHKEHKQEETKKNVSSNVQ